MRLYRFFFFLFFFSFLLHPPVSFASQTTTPSAQPTEEELLAIGKTIYREGLLADGEPVRAYVMGDIEVLGTQFTCLNCHGQSGMGGAEGKTFTLAINHEALYNPRSDMYLERSAYTDETLETSLRQGVTPEGIKLTPAMPVYDLPELEMKALVTYLKNLSRDHSPGVTDEEIHFAVVVSEGADQVQQEAMLGVMQGFIDDKNGRTRHEQERIHRGPYWQHYRLKAYRKWVLHLWQLSGPREGWQTQLEDYYREQPVFALLGGLVKGGWQPVHSWNEQHEIPALLPNTDSPGGVQSDDFYTLYFSEGMRLEARVAAADLDKTGKPLTVVQLFNSDTESSFAAASFCEAAAKLESLSVHDLLAEKPQDLSTDKIIEFCRQQKADSLILWLAAEELQQVQLNFQKIDRTLTGDTYLSATLLGGILSPLPEGLGNRVKLINPFILPERQVDTFDRIKFWLQRKNIDITSPRIQGQAFYTCMVIGEGLMHIKRHFYRDYLLDALDHGNAKSIFSVNYPRLSFGPRQRYLAKGAYVVENPHLGTSETPAPAVWTVPYM